MYTTRFLSHKNQYISNNHQYNCIFLNKKHGKSDLKLWVKCKLHLQYMNSSNVKPFMIFWESFPHK